MTRNERRLYDALRTCVWALEGYLECCSRKEIRDSFADMDKAAHRGRSAMKRASALVTEGRQ